MKFSSLISLQTESLEDELIGRYEHETRFSYRDDTHMLELSSKRIKKIFRELDSATQEKYLTSITRDYILSRPEFEQRFGKASTALEKRGFYLWNEKQKHFIPPDEFVHRLVEGSLISVLITSRKDDLVRCYSEKVSHLSKPLLLKRVLSDSYQRFDAKSLSTAELDSIDEQLRPLELIIDNVYDSERWDEVARALKIELHSSKQWWGSYYFEDHLAAFDHYLKPLFHSKVLFLTGRSPDFVLKVNPLLAKQLKHHRLASTRKKLSDCRRSLKPLSKSTASLDSVESFHISPDQLLRIAVFLLAWLESGRVGLTRDCLPMIVDMRRYAKLLSPDKQQEPLYLRVLSHVHQKCCSSAVKKVTKPGKGKSVWRSFAELPEEKMLALLLNCDDEPIVGCFIRFVDTLPQGEWIRVEDAQRLFELYYLMEGEYSRHVNELPEYFHELIFRAQIMGRIDALLPKTKGKEEKNFSKAIRVVSPQVKMVAAYDVTPLVIQGNLEIAVPFDISPSRLFSAAQVFDVGDINTLKFTQEAAVKLANANLDSAQVHGVINNLLSNELPPSGSRILSRIFKERVRVYYDGHVLYLYDQSAFPLVQKLIPEDKIADIIDERLLILSYNVRNAVIISKLEKNNVVVERGGLLKTKGY